MFGGWVMPAYSFRSEPGAAELRRMARRESGRVCQRVLMIANMLEGMEHEEAARLAGLSRSAAYEWHNRYEEDGIEGLRDRPRPGRQPRVDAVTGARFKERIVAGAELERDGVVAFRAVDAQRILKEEFDIDCSLSSTYRLLHRRKLSCVRSQVAADGHAVVILDGASWHNSHGLVVPGNITLLALPPYSPELNPVERIWHYLRSHWLANSVFRSLADIMDACEMAWNRFAADHSLIRSLCAVAWAPVSPAQSVARYRTVA